MELPSEYGCVHLVFYASYLWPLMGCASPYQPVPLLFDAVAAGEYKVENNLDFILGQSGTKYPVQ